MKEKIKKYTFLAVPFLALAALLMIFAVAVVHKESTVYQFTGWQTAFGFTAEEAWGSSVVRYEILKFSFLNIMPYILLMGGIVVYVIDALGKGKTFFGWITAGLFLVAAVFFFLSIVGIQFGADVDFAIEELLMGPGPIIGGICSILASLCAATTPVMNLIEAKK